MNYQHSRVDMTPVITMVREGLVADDPRYQVLDRNHVLDSSTGYKFHFYEDHYKVTYDDGVVYTSDELQDSYYYNEHKVMNSIRAMLDHHFRMKDVREAFENRTEMYNDYMQPKPAKPTKPVETLGANTLSKGAT